MKDVMKSVDEFDEAIVALDKLTAKGWAIYRLALRAFTKARDNETLDKKTTDKLLRQYRGRHNQWYEEVRKSIEQLTDRNYYWVLFLSVPTIYPTDVSFGNDISVYVGFFESEIQVLNDILTMLEERRGTVVRQEVAKVERDASVLYEITYVGREIKINDIYLSKPDFMSENEQFFSYIFERPWQPIKIEAILADLKLPKFKKSVSQMLSDLRFTGDVRKIFCPDASSKGIEFRNSITRGYADEHHLPLLGVNSRNDKK
jgi:hypothetical protein